MNDTDLDFGLGDDDAPEQVETEQTNDGDAFGTEPEKVETQADGTVTEKVDEPVETEEEAKARKEAEAAAAKEKGEAALEEFKSAANAALDHEDRDADTGVLPVVVISSLKDLYLKLPGAAYKNPAKAFLLDRMQEEMIAGTSGDAKRYLNARTFLELNKEVEGARATKTQGAVTQKVDPTLAHVERVASLMIAPNLVPVGEGVEDGWEDQVEKLVESLSDDIVKYRNWQAEVAAFEPKSDDDKAPEAPEVHASIVAAAKIAAGRTVSAKKAGTTQRASTAGSGHRGDIVQHLREAIEKFPVGEFVPVAELCKVETSQYGGDKPAPSPGAIANQLRPEKEFDFLEVRTEPKRGAVRKA